MTQVINQNSTNSIVEAISTCQTNPKPGPVNNTPKVITQRITKAMIRRVF